MFVITPSGWAMLGGTNILFLAGQVLHLIHIPPDATITGFIIMAEITMNPEFCTKVVGLNTGTLNHVVAHVTFTTLPVGPTVVGAPGWSGGPCHKR